MTCVCVCVYIYILAIEVDYKLNSRLLWIKKKGSVESNLMG